MTIEVGFPATTPVGSFDADESGEITLYGFNGSKEDVVIYVNEDNYDKVFITNMAANTVYSKVVK